MTCDLLVRSPCWTLAERLAVVVSAVLLKRRRLVDCPTGGPLLPDSKGIDFSFAAAGGVTVEEEPSVDAEEEARKEAEAAEYKDKYDKAIAYPLVDAIKIVQQLKFLKSKF